MEQTKRNNDMTVDEFLRHWETSFPEASFLGYRLREKYPERWFRVHSLPQSKRYADTAEEKEILLDRQNRLMTDLLGEDAALWLVTGEYRTPGNDGVHEMHECLQHLAFSPLPPIHLHALDPEAYDEGTTFHAYVAPLVWMPHRYNDLLIATADDELRCYFVHATQARIVAPYDGGMDIILNDTATRNVYRTKYAHWLSVLPSGL